MTRVLRPQKFMYKMSFDLVENFLIVSNLYDNLRKIRLLNICDQKKAVF